MPSKCKICIRRVESKERREDGLCLVCAGLKKRCEHCRRRFDVEHPGALCPRCAAKYDQWVETGKPLTEPKQRRYPSQSVESQRLRSLQKAYQRLGLGKLFSKGKDGE